MSAFRSTVSVGVVLALLPLLAHAQTPTEPDNARVQLGPVALAPTVSITNVGYDSNVYYEAENPRSDVTATVRPTVDGWLRHPRVRATGRSEVDGIYYKDLSDLRAVDSAHSGRIEIPLNRLTPYAAGARALTRHRRNLEIDAPVERLEQFWGGGVDLQVTPKAIISVGASRSRVEYEGDTLYLGSDLAQVLNRSSTGQRLAVRYALTPLTTTGVDVEWGQDRFAFASDRDSNSVLLAPFVEFKPLALVSGRAQIGFRRRAFVDNPASAFEGTVAHVDLQYTFLGRTQFGVQIDRDVSYSYRLDLEEYLQNGFGVTVTHRLVEPWSVSGSASRFRLSYRGGPTADTETIDFYGVGVAYRIGRTVLGTRLDHQARHSDVSPVRDYDRMRLSSSVTYIF